VKTIASDPAVKAEALRLASEHGPAEASARTGVPASTIRMWRTRAKQAPGGKPSGPPAGVDPIGWAERKEAGANATYRAATEALERVRELLKAGEERKAKDAAIALGILLDKSGILENAAQAQQDRQLRLAQATGQQLAAIIHLAFEAIGIRPTESVRALVADLLRQASSGGPLVVSPALAQPAWSDVRERLRAEILQELEEERLALPAPSEPDEPDVVKEIEPEPADPKRESSEDEITDADVMPDLGSEDPMHPVIGSMRRRPWTGRSSNGGAIGPRDPHSIFGPGSNMRSPGGSL
jgi:hypothetical protein